VLDEVAATDVGEIGSKKSREIGLNEALVPTCMHDIIDLEPVELIKNSLSELFD
jgi:hypothetical protein